MYTNSLCIVCCLLELCFQEEERWAAAFDLEQGLAFVAVNLGHPRSVEQIEAFQADFSRAELLFDHAVLTGSSWLVRGAVPFVMLDELTKTGGGVDGHRWEDEENCNFHD